jgi:hypothetical protein
MGGNKPSAKLTTGYVGYTINFDSDEAPGELLRVNDTVNLLGIFPGEDGYRTYRIISNLRVVGIGKSGQEVGPGEGGIRRYDSILVDVPPEVSLPMENIETHKIGSYRLEVNPPQQAIGKKPEINPALTEFAQKAKSPYGGRGGFGGFPRSGGGDD